MRPRLAPLTLAALLAAPAALADVAPSEPSSASRSDVSDKVGAQVTETLDQMEREVSLGQPVLTSIQQLGEQIEAMPGSAELRSRLSGAVQDLADRAARSLISSQEMASFRNRIVHAQVDEVLASLREEAARGKWTADEAAGVLSHWVHEARLFTDAPDPAAYRARVTQAAEIAAIGAQSAAESILEMRVMLIQGQLEEARQQLEQRVDEGTASRSDYLRLYDLMSRRARMVQGQGIGV